MSSWKRCAANPKVENFLENMVSRHSGISALQQEKYYYKKE